LRKKSAKTLPPITITISCCVGRRSVISAKLIITTFAVWQNEDANLFLRITNKRKTKADYLIFFSEFKFKTLKVYVYPPRSNKSYAKAKWTFKTEKKPLV